MPRIPQSQSAGALPGVGKATSGLQQNGGFVVGDSSRMTWGTIDITSDGPTAAMVKGWPRWAIPGQALKPLQIPTLLKSECSQPPCHFTCQSAKLGCNWLIFHDLIFYIILERYLFERVVFVFHSGFLALVAFLTFVAFAAFCLVNFAFCCLWFCGDHWLLAFCGGMLQLLCRQGARHKLDRINGR